MAPRVRNFGTRGVDGGELSASYPGRFTAGTNLIRGLVGPRAGLDAVTRRKIPDPARNQTPGS
jgi:hypothetical protein